MLYPEIATELKRFGFATAIMGSLARDLDLIAIPWVEKFQPAEDAVDHLRGILGATEVQGPYEKPHGRRTWILIIREFKIDLSFSGLLSN